MGETGSIGDSGRRALLVVDTHGHGPDRRGATGGRRSKGRARDAEVAAAALEAGGMVLVRRDIEKPDELGPLITGLRHKVDCVVLAGSDSLANAAAIALRDADLPLGLVPLGRASVVAETLGLLQEPEAAAAVILAGATRKLDIGSVNGRPFFGAASIGMPVEATERLGRAARGRLGGFGFVFASARAALAHSKVSALVRCDSAVWRVRTMQLTIGNGRFYAPAAVVLPEEQPPGQPLCIFSLEPGVRSNLLTMGGTFAGGEYDSSEVRAARGRVVEVVTRLSVPVSVDGEVVTVTPARFSVLREAVTVYAPAPEPVQVAETAMAEEG